MERHNIERNFGKVNFEGHYCIWNWVAMFTCCSCQIVNRQVDYCGHRKWSKSDKVQTIWGSAYANTAGLTCAGSTAAAPWEHTEREPPATATGTFLFIQNYSTRCDTSRFDRDGGGKLKCWHRIYKCNVTKRAPALPLTLKTTTFASAVRWQRACFLQQLLTPYSTVFQSTLELWDQQNWYLIYIYISWRHPRHPS